MRSGSSESLLVQIILGFPDPVVLCHSPSPGFCTFSLPDIAVFIIFSLPAPRVFDFSLPDYLAVKLVVLKVLGERGGSCRR